MIRVLVKNPEEIQIDYYSTNGIHDNFAAAKRAVLKQSKNIDLNELLESWMVEGNLDGDFEEYVKEKIGG